MRLITLSILILFSALITPIARADSWIKGSPDFRQRVLSALSFVQTSDADDYAKTIRYINIIEENNTKGWSWIYGYDGMCKVELSARYAEWQHDNLYQLGGDLVHEGSLCHDYFTGNTADVRADEIRALQVQRQFYVHSHAPQYLVDYMNQLIAQNWPWGK